MLLPSAAGRWATRSFNTTRQQGVLRRGGGSTHAALAQLTTTSMTMAAAMATSQVAAAAAATAEPAAAVAALGTKWKAHGSQQDFMLRDSCITVDECDAVVGAANKYDAHRFTPPEQPRGLLHRAFSVFLFGSDGKLLLQQRAASKITFPLVWTNTCCSHQLHGQDPEELDTDAAIADGSVPGAKAAAVRKLQHELGIDPQELPASSFKFLTRLHYCARDTGTHGPDAPWGEHEIDYILLAKADIKTLNPNPDEVADVKRVTLEELRAMMAPGSGLKWSPWFRIIAEKWLPTWWGDLDAALATDKHVDAATVHRIDCAE